MSGYPVDLVTTIAGEPGSGKTLTTQHTAAATVIDGTSAVTLGGGVANDALLLGVVILANGTAVTATIGGFYKRNDSNAEAAQAFVLTGLTTVDTVVNFGNGLRNMAGALTVTASVDEKVIAIWNEA